MINTLFTNDNLFILSGLNSQSIDLIYLDPPFNSKRLYSAPIGSKSAGASFKDMWTWQDINEAYLDKLVSDYPMLVDFVVSVEELHSKAMKAYITYMTQRIIEMHRVLKETGSIYLHCDPTASHYLKVVLDRIFGKENFRNEIVWAYNWGGRPKNCWARKHDIILMYSKNKQEWSFNSDDIRVPYMTQIEGRKNPLVSRERHMKGQIPTDVWNLPVIHANSEERTGYPTQKPLALLHRIVKASSNEGDIVLDPFCGCATTCVAAQQLNRYWIGIDIEEKAVDVLVERLSNDAKMFKDFVQRNDIPQRTDIKIEKPTPGIKKILYTNQKGHCNACRVEMRIFDFEIDHIIPTSKGGGDYFENYQLLCGNCNRVKGNKPMEYLLSKLKARKDGMNIRVFG